MARAVNRYHAHALALVNGRVWPGADDAASAVLVQDGVIAAVGTDRDVLALVAPSDDLIDVGGRPILPGFVDSHVHFHRHSLLRRYFLDFSGETYAGIDDVLRAVADRAAQTPSGSWLQGDNLASGRLRERRLPTRRDLDSVAPEHPVLLRGVGKHVAAANSLALRQAGIDRETPDPPGGRIERDLAGEPTGVLHERGKLRLDTTRADTVVPAFGEEDRLIALREGIAALHRSGVTTIHEICRAREEFADYARLRERDQLDVRVVAYIRVVEAQATLDGLVSAGLRSGFGDDWLRLGGVKASIDGMCALRNAAVYDPYPGEPANRGIVRIEQEELDTVVAAADANGLAVAVHAIGPRAVDMALTSFSRARATNPPSALRHRIEHAYLPPRPGQLRRICELGLMLSTQPSFIWSIGDVWADIFGTAEARRMVPLRSAVHAGVTTLINSDCPTAPVNPMLALAAAAGRATRSGNVLGEAEAIGVGEAIDMQTLSPAYAAGQEHHAGRIAPGMLGDIVVLDDDPRVVPVSQLSAVPVFATVVGGGLAYRQT